MHCTQCGAEASGRFCASCGASLQSIQCPGCGTAISPGTRFCTSCGSPARAPSAPSGVADARVGKATPSQKGGENLGWFVAGSLLILILAAIAFQTFAGSGGEEPAPAVASSLGPTGTVDLASMTPREAADRLFTRVMAAMEQGNDSEAMSFLPMAIDAYGLARPLDDDGLYHLALLQGATGDFAASLATATEGLATTTEHLLLLSSAAEAAKELGDETAALGYYTLLLDAWDREMALLRQEYTDHSRILPLLREDAENYLAGEGR